MGIDNISNNKRIAKNSIYLYLRMIISLLIGLYTSRVFLDALGVEDYGIYNVVGGFVALLNAITSSLVQGAQRFITFELGKGDFCRLRRTFATISTLFVILAVVLFTIGALIGPTLVNRVLVIPEKRIGAATFVFFCSLASFAINLISVPYNASIIAHERMNFYAIVSIGESLSKLLIAYILYSTSFDKLKVYALLIVIVGLVVRLVYGLYCSKYFTETKIKFFLDKNILKDVASFSVWMALGGTAFVAREQGVNMVINYFCGVTINAARGVSTQINSCLNQFSSSISLAIKPQITKSYAEGNIERSISLTFLLNKALCIMILLITVPLYFEIDYVLGIWLKDIPYYTNHFSQWVLIVAFLANLRNTYEPYYLAIGNIKTLQWISSLIYILILPLSFFALKLGYEPISTMQITAIIEMALWLVCYTYLYCKYGFPLGRYFKKVVLPLLVLVAITIVLVYVSYIIFSFSGLMRFLVTVGISMVSIFSLSFLLLLSKHEQQGIINFLKNKLRRSTNI